MIPFRTQYDKLVKAYLNNEVKPDFSCACFVGNLLGGDNSWAFLRSLNITNNGVVSNPYISGLSFYQTILSNIKRISDNTYTIKDLCVLEEVFMGIIIKDRVAKGYSCIEIGYVGEDALFEAFEATLLKLREIHEAKGEVVEDYVFTKRVLPLTT